jgi:hypothetical protein
MNLNNSDLNSKSLNTRLRDTLFRIQDSIQIDRKSYQEILGISATRFAEIAFQSSDISIYELYSIANALDLDIDLIFSGDIDYKALARRYKGDLKAIPEKYQNPSEKLGRARASQVIYSHLMIYHGERFARAYFRRLQLYPDAFTDSVEFVHPLIAIDLMKNLTREGYEENQIRSIGTMTLAVTPKVHQKALSKTKTPKNLYSYILEEFAPKYYDRMYQYKLDQLSNSKCRVITQTTEFAESVFRGKNIDNRESCLFRQGVFSSFLGVFGKRFARIEEISCIHRGDSKCVIDISWI